MQRFLLAGAALGAPVTISDPDFVNQVGRVLRSRPGDAFVLFNGDGLDRPYRLVSAGKSSVALEPAGAPVRNAADPDVRVEVWQALPNKHEKLEWLVEKGVEAGVSAFRIFRSARSQDLFMNDRKLERLNAIAKEALEQCGRNRPAEVSLEKAPPADLSGAYVLHTEPGALDLPALRKAARGAGKCVLLVGPEGGFSPEEIAKFAAAGARTAHFGPRTLRTESAAPFAAFALLQG